MNYNDEGASDTPDRDDPSCPCKTKLQQLQSRCADCNACFDENIAHFATMPYEMRYPYEEPTEIEVVLRQISNEN